MPSLIEHSSGRERLRIACALGFWAVTYLLFVTWNQFQDQYPLAFWQSRRLVSTLWGALMFFGFTRLADRVSDRGFRERAIVLGGAAIACFLAMIICRALVDSVFDAGIDQSRASMGNHIRFTLIWGGYFAGGALAFLSFAPRPGGKAQQAEASPAKAPPESANDSAWPDALWVSRGRETVRVPVESIEWIEAEGDYVRLHAHSGGGLLRATLTGLETKLDPAAFARVHRSAICRRSSIAAMLRKPSGAIAVRLETGAEVPVGRSYRDSVAELLGPAKESQSRVSA